MYNSFKNKFDMKKFLPAAKKMMVFSLAAIWLVYLFSVNHASSQSFKLNDLSQTLQETEHQILLLNVQSGELQSIERIENASKNLSLVQTKDVYYLANGSDAVALK